MRNEVVKHLDHDPDFEWRGQNVTRIENLSDIVFALALGMLLLTGAPPQTFVELIHFLVSIIPVAAGFVILFMIWNAHFVFFRRYGLADNQVVILNAVLLLAVLFIAYPLRFIFDSLFWFVAYFVTGDDARLVETNMDLANSARSMAVFGSAYAVIYSLLSLMYAHAYSKAKDIGLSVKERLITRQTIWIFRGEVIIAIFVALGALFTPLGPFAGFLMLLNWPYSVLTSKMVARLEARPTANEIAAGPDE